MTKKRVNSRAKGKQGEREVIAMLQPVVNSVYQEFQLEVPKLKRDTTQADGGGSDIVGRGLHWMALEVKFHKEESVESWWAQCVRQAGREQVPILLYRTNNKPWKCRMFGLLGTRSTGRTCPVTVSIEDFLAWFRLKLVEELS